ncbi:peptidoglycan-binding domain-containing protein [Sphingomonas segetis]|jgi:peptidoglycan hydrolase-like protein with peptidoglycan-binding domain|uniref:peptidoglycan-binding domain-containing protein n=1 Tax=Sphingomonas segetis TaxID=1104779 RepID=UPI0012D2EA8B|nr:peptidoglycan-binding domain-containing protein [Sphingomonas segetis]
MALACSRFSSNAQVLAAASNNPPLKQGAQGEGVRVLQLALIDLGFSMPASTGAGGSLPDGIFGSETARVVSDFQRMSGLAADGEAGTETLTQLDRSIAALSEAAAQAEPLPVRK